MLVSKPFFFPETINAIRAQLSGRPTLKLIFTNSGWLVGDKLLRLFIGLFITAWVARYLGPEQYGKLAYVITFLAIFQAFSLLGLDSIVVRNIAQSPTDANQILGTTLRVRLVAATLSFVVACTSIYFIYPKKIEFQLLVFLVGFGIIFQTADIVDLWFQSQSQSRRTVITKAISYAIAAAVKVVLIFQSAPLWLFAAAIGGETALSAIGLYISYKKYPVIKSWVWDSSLAKKMLRESFPLLISGISIIIYMKSSQLIINERLGSTAVGIYATAQMLSELWYFLPLTLAISVAPILARKKTESEKSYNNALQNIFVLMWFISISISVGISIFSELIVTILFGEEYLTAASVLSIHIFTLIPVCIGVTQSLWLINENKSYLALYQSMAGAISSLGLNVFLISKYGIEGGAFATIISQIIQAFVVNAFIAPALFRLQVSSLFMLISKSGDAILFIMGRAGKR
jgi:PST family polysaccharide transporter